MNRLTPELTLIASLGVASNAVESQELDFNLARRSAVVINSIQSTLMEIIVAATGTPLLNRAVQEIDRDPDNTDVLGGGSALGDSLEIDSSRVMRHVAVAFSSQQVIGTDAGAGMTTPLVSILKSDFRMLPIEQRPISITNLSHHVRVDQAGVLAGLVDGQIVMNYIIVELTLQELGIINATRR
ncbi:hypothetical protein LCGC14_1489120 [marine sediment metagenome]|uniref:Uncharacterized protein n=1 Tax=marine sediment metagenome TaxID=412755 RepID=A0A0F9J793_9ZZZZ